METINDGTICTRCGRDKGFKSKEQAMCHECKRELADSKYLDEGSEQIIKENADRPKQVRIDLNEQEAELDKMLEEF